MSGIDPTLQLAAMVRVQLASLRQRTIDRRAGSSGSRASGPSGVAGDLATTLAQRIRAIPPGDPDRERTALRIFLETSLLSELGQDLLNDPAFPVMVDHVQQQMASDPVLAEASLKAARLLLASA